MHETKHVAIASYLKDQFPGHTVEQKHDFSRRAQTFVVSGEEGPYFLKVSDELIMDNSALAIQRLLKASKVSKAMRSGGGSGILLTQSGIDSLNS